MSNTRKRPKNPGVPRSLDPEIGALQDHFDTTLAEVSALMNRLMKGATLGDSRDINRALNIAGVLTAGGRCLLKSIEDQCTDKRAVREDADDIIEVARGRMVWTPTNPAQGVGH